MEVKDKVFNAMFRAGKPIRTVEAAELAGVEKKDAEKAIKTLNAEGRVFSPARCMWQVKKE